VTVSAPADIPFTLSRAVLATPVGDMVALSSDEGLCALEFVDVPARGWRALGPAARDARLTRLEKRLARWFPPHRIAEDDNAIIRATRDWLTAYFDGRSADVSPIRLDMRGADFEKRVWKALLTIPVGVTTSYGAIAKQLGDVGASRAVGLANGSNPIAIIVPCHRVIGSNGSLTGYGGGLERKTWLIDHERRWRTDSLF
jgi:methylated-DNA-[protein]-cysteine S-methyltransferase